MALLLLGAVAVALGRPAAARVCLPPEPSAYPAGVALRVYAQGDPKYVECGTLWHAKVALPKEDTCELDCLPGYGAGGAAPDMSGFYCKTDASKTDGEILVITWPPCTRAFRVIFPCVRPCDLSCPTLT